MRVFYIEQIKKDSKIEEDNFKTQKKYGFAIFLIVNLLVVSGIAFSLIQLINAMKIGNFSQFETSIEIQQAGNLALRTSAIGAFVLIVSLVFFFLFLQFVYKPNNVRKNMFENIKDVSKF